MVEDQLATLLSTGEMGGSSGSFRMKGARVDRAFAVQSFLIVSSLFLERLW